MRKPHIVYVLCNSKREFLSDIVDLIVSHREKIKDIVTINKANKILKKEFAL